MVQRTAAADPATSSTSDLWDRFRAFRDPAVRALLIEHYLPLARSAAARCFRMRADDAVPFADYLQYARVGLVEAVDGFDPGREASFATYSSYRIRGAILNGIARESEASAQKTFWRARMEERVASLKPRPTSSDDDELEELARMTMGLALSFLLDSETFDIVDEGPQANPYAATELAQMREAVRAAVAKLPDRERQLIRSHYFEQREFRVVARELAVTPGRVSQLHAQALSRIRELLRATSALDREM